MAFDQQEQFSLQWMDTHFEGHEGFGVTGDFWCQGILLVSSQKSLHRLKLYFVSCTPVLKGKYKGNLMEKISYRL